MHSPNEQGESSAAGKVSKRITITNFLMSGDDNLFMKYCHLQLSTSLVVTDLNTAYTSINLVLVISLTVSLWIWISIIFIHFSCLTPDSKRQQLLTYAVFSTYIIKNSVPRNLHKLWTFICKNKNLLNYKWV